MQDNSRLIMKNKRTNLATITLVTLSMMCFIFVNQIEKKQTSTTSSYQEFTQSTDRVITSVKTMSIVVDKMVDFITKREV